MRFLLMALALSPLSFPLAAQAASLRCGADLVSDGASKADVLVKCGEPMAKDSRSETEETKQRGADGEFTKRTVHKTIEEWTYNFGPNRFMQVVVFENGKLIDVRSTGYGR